MFISIPVCGFSAMYNNNNHNKITSLLSVVNLQADDNKLSGDQFCIIKTKFDRPFTSVCAYSFYLSQKNTQYLSISA